MLINPLWIEPYLDANGLGELTTCSIPFYDRNVNPPLLLGVLAIDLSNRFTTRRRTE